MTDGTGPGGVDRPLRIAVIGAASPSAEDYAAARRAGEAIGRSGAILISGGRSGVMEASARGAAESGGLTVGILPGPEPSGANPWIALPVATGIGEARNAVVVGSADAVLAVGGSWGTLSEIAFARKRGLAVALLGEPPAEGLGLERFTDPEAAARWCLERAREHRGIA